MVAMAWDPLRGLVVQADDVPTATSGWVPPVDILETRDAYVISIELPGLDRDDVRVTIEGERITLAGERPTLAVAGAQFHRMERGQGSFRRVFALPLAIEPSQVTAEARDGVVTVTLPKAKPAEARQVEIG